MPVPLLRPALHVWFRLSRGLTLGVRAAVIDAEARVFLVRHTYVPGWHLPGGGVEIGESTGAALERELAEEAGIAVAGAPALHGVFFRGREARRDHVVVFVVREFRQLAEKRPDWEIAGAGFFPLDALPDATTLGTRDRLDEIAGRRPVSDVW